MQDSVQRVARRTIARVVVLADSLAMARPPEEGDVPIESTYPVLLQRMLMKTYGADAPVVFNAAKRYRTMPSVRGDWYEEVVLRNADLVVVHVGVVDCAPRVLLPAERRWLERVRPYRVQLGIRRWIHSHRRQLIQRRPHRVYVRPPLFDASLAEILRRAEEAPRPAVLFVSVQPPPAAVEDRSPGFRDSVARYNAMLRARCQGPRIRLIDIEETLGREDAPRHLTADGIHLNVSGQQLVADALMHAFRDLAGEGPA